MSMEVKNIETKERWENFIKEMSPHTFLQNWEWRMSQEILGNKVFNLGIFCDQEMIGVAFVYIIRAKRGSFLFCPHGPLIREDWNNAFKILFDHLKKIAQEEKLDFIRISPLEKKTAEKIALFSELGFKIAPMHMHPELAWMLDITISEEDLLKNMSKRTRNSINKAKRDGVEVVGSDDMVNLDEFYEIYLATANRQVFVPFSKSYVRKEFEIFRQDGKILLFSAKYNHETIATAMVIFSNGSGFYHHGASVRKHSGIPASEILQWCAILEAKKRGMALYNFWGIAPEGNKNHPWVGLSRFKKGFGGFSEEYIPTQDYPLTLKYWINYIIETIRRVKRKY